MHFFLNLPLTFFWFSWSSSEHTVMMQNSKLHLDLNGDSFKHQAQHNQCWYHPLQQGSPCPFLLDKSLGKVKCQWPRQRSQRTHMQASHLPETILRLIPLQIEANIQHKLVRAAHCRASCLTLTVSDAWSPGGPGSLHGIIPPGPLKLADSSWIASWPGGRSHSCTFPSLGGLWRLKAEAWSSTRPSASTPPTKAGPKPTRNKICPSKWS
jgi:hypothetical protein